MHYLAAVQFLARALALPGGQHHPAFLIERDFACAAKHDM